MGRKIIWLAVIACGIVFVESKPAKGESEGFASEGEPPRVAESDKTSYFIGTSDVLTPEEKIYLHEETKSKGIFYLLKKDSNLTDLTENYLTELASNGKCAKEMETFDRCVQNQKDTKILKVPISTSKVSQERKADIKQFSVKDSDGETFSVDEDCTNNQIDLEKCVISNNRFFPCPPPPRNLTQYKKLFKDRSAQFAKIIEADGFILSKSKQNFEFGYVTGYEILNYNETYETHVKKFLDELPKSKLPEPYEALKNNFLKIQAIVPANSLNFNKLKEAFKTAACRKEILASEEPIKAIVAAEKKFKKPSSELKNAFESFNKSLNDFFALLPEGIQEKCESEKDHQAHVQSKIKILELLELSC